MLMPLPPLGTEDLEDGMRPTRARDVVAIAVISVAMLLVFNPQSLVDWTRRQQDERLIATVGPAATSWNDLMERLGPARAFKQLRQTVQRVLVE
jgi:hypothetical protein